MRKRFYSGHSGISSRVLGSLIFYSGLVLGMEPTQFQESLRLLKRSQKDADQRLFQLGVKTRSGFSASAADSSESGSSDSDQSKARRPLFTMHNDARLIRAEAGRWLFGLLENRIVTSADSVPVVVKLTYGQGLFSGLKALGKAGPSQTEGRIAILFDRIVTRQGKTISIQGIGEDEAGAFGLEAQVFSSKAWAVAGAMASSFVSGLATSQQTLAPTALGFSEVQPTGRNAILQGLSQTAADQSKRLIEEGTQEKPIMIVESETPVTLYLEQEVRF